MNHAILPLIERSGEFAQLVQTIRGGQTPCSVFGVTHHAKPFVAQAIAQTLKQQVLCVTTTEQAARGLAQACGGVFLAETELSLRLSAAKSRESELLRMGVLKSAHKQSVVFLSVGALLRRMLPPTVFEQACIPLRVGETHRSLQEKLVQNGYEHAGTVYSPGEFARRGEILDVFPADSQHPVRVTFFDDEIESIRFFDAETQKSFPKERKEYLLPPAREIILTLDAKQRMREYLAGQEQSDVAADILFEMEEYGAFESADSFLPVLYDPASVLDYFPNALLLFDDFARIEAEAQQEQEEFERAFLNLQKEKEVFAVQGESMLKLASILHRKEMRILDFAGVQQGALKTVSECTLQFRAMAGYNGNLQQLADMMRERNAHGFAVYLFAGGKAKAVSDALLEYGVMAPISQEMTGNAAVSEELISFGFELPSANCAVLGASEIFGRIQKQAVKRSKRKRNQQEELFSDLSPGDFVVHDVHGKGKYLGLKTLTSAGATAEYMELEYRGGDKLYIPTAQIDRVQKYIGSKDAPPQLSKLGGKEWENAKSKARESALKLAFDLVALYAQRFESNGHAYAADTVWQRQFEEAFEFQETDGQLRSIEEIKKDMESPRVMDRLLLGDVGYGKTEVAMRAAMKAVMDGKQVAVLVPTTLLARQHLKTFRRRFADFPVRIAGISRFSKAKHKEILESVKKGRTDIIIGTHRLLSKDVHYYDLGLLVVDEEQRFGVGHKEQIKLLKQQVDVLTLSATPIPRTLEMSLVGIRDMSTIDTPPTMRKQPYSYVMRYSGGLLRDAVMREIEREGQVYFVCRQIREMDELLRELQTHVPEARVAAAHGQMSESQMEHIVSGFIDGEYDVLLCTTIIESGIDIPRVNTILVYEADKFGLSQLYQLKGRVGRSDKVSYAYFTYLGDRILNEDAAKRLEAIREFTQLGSGYKIAMRDLQIRGAGNLLGAEQSGHMATVGYAMYCKLMREAVNIAKGKEVRAEFETAVELNISAYIPDSYIEDQTDKMDIYKLITKIRSVTEGKETAKEIAERYGKIPREVNNLIVAAIIKRYAQAAGIASVIRKPDCIELKYAEQVNVDIKGLLHLAQKYQEECLLRASTPPVMVFKLTQEVPTGKFLEFIAGLTKYRLKDKPLVILPKEDKAQDVEQTRPS